MFGYVTLIYINNEILPYFYLSNVRDLDKSYVLDVYYIKLYNISNISIFILFLCV